MDKEYLKKPCASHGEAINKAAECLPEGYQLKICIEQGAAWIELLRPDGETTSFIDCDGLIDEINTAIKFANGIFEE